MVFMFLIFVINLKSITELILHNVTNDTVTEQLFIRILKKSKIHAI